MAERTFSYALPLPQLGFSDAHRMVFPSTDDAHEMCGCSVSPDEVFCPFLSPECGPGRMLSCLHTAGYIRLAYIWLGGFRLCCWALPPRRVPSGAYVLGLVGTGGGAEWSTAAGTRACGVGMVLGVDGCARWMRRARRDGGVILMATCGAVRVRLFLWRGAVPWQLSARHAARRRPAALDAARGTATGMGHGAAGRRAWRRGILTDLRSRTRVRVTARSSFHLARWRGLTHWPEPNAERNPGGTITRGGPGVG
jgi:hypothetical protein